MAVAVAVVKVGLAPCSEFSEGETDFLSHAQTECRCGVQHPKRHQHLETKRESLQLCTAVTAKSQVVWLGYSLGTGHTQLPLLLMSYRDNISSCPRYLHMSRNML